MHLCGESAVSPEAASSHQLSHAWLLCFLLPLWAQLGALGRAEEASLFLPWSSPIRMDEWAFRSVSVPLHVPVGGGNNSGDVGMLGLETSIKIT